MSYKVNFRNTALIRVDFNVPTHNNKILDLSRIYAAIPTIKHCLNKRMSVVLMSHFGRPSKPSSTFSLKQLVVPLSKILKQKILFCSNIVEGNRIESRSLNQGEVLLLESLRFYPGETTNDVAFAKLLSKYGSIYINDAFAASHREHASISAIKNYFPDKKKFRGFLLSNEIKQLDKLSISNRPYSVVVGGSKIGSKIHILKAFLDIADYILIGGGMAFPFIKYQGGQIGKSLCNDSEIPIVEEFLNNLQNSTTKLVLPIDCVSTTSIKDQTGINISDINSIASHSMGVDIGPKTIELFKTFIVRSKSIMWNGPMGISEIENFSKGTKKMCKAIADSTKNGSYSLIGGGDTVSDISRFGFKDKFSYVSTGGGAMLEFFKFNQLNTTLDLKELT